MPIMVERAALELRLTALRWVLILLAAGFYFTSINPVTPGTIALGLISTFVALTVNLLVWHHQRRHHRMPKSVAIAESSSLTVILALGVYLTGGIDSPLLLLLAYALMVAVARFSGAEQGVLVLLVLAGVTAAIALAPHGSFVRVLLVLATFLCIAYFTHFISQSEVRLRSFALTDPLTGLANRRRLHEAFQSANRVPGQQLAVAVVDVNGLKDLNDTYGHQMGDRAIVAVAQQLQQLAHPGGLVARWGGDEFVVLAAGQEAVYLEDRLQALRPVVLCAGLEAGCTWGIAFGVAPQASLDNLFNLADGTLYSRKQRARVRSEAAPAR